MGKTIARGLETRSVGKPQKQRAVPGLDGGFVVLGLSTSKMSKDEMSELLELALAFGAQKGVEFENNLTDKERKYLSRLKELPCSVWTGRPERCTPHSPAQPVPMRAIVQGLPPGAT